MTPGTGAGATCGAAARAGAGVGAGNAGDFAAHLTTQIAGEAPQDGVVRVNHPLDMAGDRIYLMGNGYAPTITIRNADGDVVYSESVPFLPQDKNMTSLGVIKVPDGMPKQLGLVGFFYPTQIPLKSGAFSSAYPIPTVMNSGAYLSYTRGPWIAVIF